VAGPDILALSETAAMLRIRDRTACDLAWQGGRIPAAKVGGQWRIRLRDLERWLDRGGKAAAEPEGR
jgi:excisionase family DNA binding protein